MITWDDAMSTGVPEIDVQHKEIIEKHNEFAEALANYSFARQEAGDMLDFLQFYATWHFQREEQCFAKYQCPAAAANKQAHADFIRQFGHFYEQWHTEGMDLDLIKETFAELGAWIENHILRTDTQLRPCVQGTADPEA